MRQFLIALIMMLAMCCLFTMFLDRLNYSFEQKAIIVGGGLFVFLIMEAVGANRKQS